LNSLEFVREQVFQMLWLFEGCKRRRSKSIWVALFCSLIVVCGFLFLMLNWNCSIGFCGFLLLMLNFGNCEIFVAYAKSRCFVRFLLHVQNFMCFVGFLAVNAIHVLLVFWWKCVVFVKFFVYENWVSGFFACEVKMFKIFFVVSEKIRIFLHVRNLDFARFFIASSKFVGFKTFFVTSTKFDDWGIFLLHTLNLLIVKFW
jgi:hypothetical protein